jgi:hypothetical protein
MKVPFSFPGHIIPFTLGDGYSFAATPARNRAGEHGFLLALSDLI